jgi:hypothetical protein
MVQIVLLIKCGIVCRSVCTIHICGPGSSVGIATDY